jgi:hypothetical protein
MSDGLLTMAHLLMRERIGALGVSAHRASRSAQPKTPPGQEGKHWRSGHPASCPAGADVSDQAPLRDIF